MPDTADTPGLSAGDVRRDLRRYLTANGARGCSNLTNAGRLGV